MVLQLICWCKRCSLRELPKNPSSNKHSAEELIPFEHSMAQKQRYMWTYSIWTSDDNKTTIPNVQVFIFVFWQDKSMRLTWFNYDTRLIRWYFDDRIILDPYKEIAQATATCINVCLIHVKETKNKWNGKWTILLELLSASFVNANDLKLRRRFVWCVSSDNVGNMRRCSRKLVKLTRVSGKACIFLVDGQKRHSGIWWPISSYSHKAQW